MAHVKLSDEVTEILRKSTVEGNVLKLPAGQLDRKLYESVNKALVTAGGKWKTNLKGHLFDGDPMDKLGLALQSGVVIDEKKERQAFYTPQALAARVVELAGIEAGHHILEPSAGNGALLREMRGDTCRYAVEIDPDEAAKLHPWATVHCGDFLAWDGAGRTFDRIVMNPPFNKNQDVKHVAHALKFLKPSGVLVAVMWPNKTRTPFLKLIEGRNVEIVDIEAGAFKESGTGISSMIVIVRN